VGELHSDYFQTGLEVATTRPAAVGCSNISDLSCAAIKEQEYPNERRLAAEGIRSMCVVPLALQGECIGLLSLVNQRRDRYSDEDATCRV
jgi:formate hydrogenlyase transcriptional activator